MEIEMTPFEPEGENPRYGVGYWINRVEFEGVVHDVGNWITDGTAPEHPGVYNVSCRKTGQSGDWFAHWDGSRWSIASPRKQRAPGPDTMRTAPGHWHLNGSYRGLAAEHKDENA